LLEEKEAEMLADLELREFQKIKDESENWIVHPEMRKTSERSGVRLSSEE